MANSGCRVLTLAIYGGKKVQDQAFDWNTILCDVGVRHHHLYPQLDRAEFSDVISRLQQGSGPFDTLANYLIYGAAAVLGREQKASGEALAYHARLNTKTKAVSLYFWAEEAIAHQQYQTAEGLIAPLLEAYPADPFLNAMMASCCFYSQELTRGWPHLKQGLESAPRNTALNSLLCRYLIGDGDLPAAEKAASGLLDIEPNDPVAFNTLSRVAPEAIDARLMERFERCAHDPALGPITSAGIFFDLGRVYEAHQNYDQAFGAVCKANECMKTIPAIAGQIFDADQEYAQFEHQTALFDKLEPCSLPTGLTPVFIIGLPRTGSTLLDQALSAHPSTVSLGEDEIIPRIVQEAEALLKTGKVTDAQRQLRVWKARFADHARQKAAELTLAEGASDTATHAKPVRFVIDKMLGNSRHLEFLTKLFPEAIFINSCRNTMDVGLSIFFSPLHRANIYATDLSTIGDYIALEARVMAFWARRGLSPRVVQYEGLVDAFEPTLRSVMDYIGMDWHEDCLRFHQMKRPVYTYSAHQVRKKIYRQSIGRWRHYEAHLKPLADALLSGGLAADGGDAAPLSSALQTSLTSKAS